MNRLQPVVVLDLDGTLVDSVHQHVVAWLSAFADVGLQIDGTRVHAAIGLGGDRLVAHVAGDAAEWAIGDEIRAAHERHFKALIPSVVELDGATDLLERLASEHRLVLATSGNRDVTDQLLSRVDGAHVLSATVTGSEVEQSKPAPDLLLEAVHRVEATHGIVIGDAVWDVRAADACGFPCIGLRSGGTSGEALTEAGAAWVFDGPRDLLNRLEQSPLSA